MSEVLASLKQKGGGDGNSNSGFFENVAANTTLTIDVPSKPKYIAVVQKGNTGASSASVYTFIYDEDYSAINSRYVGNGTTATPMKIGPTNASNFTSITSNQIVFHQNSGYSSDRVEYMYIL